jgi:hypothetical protein
MKMTLMEKLKKKSVGKPEGNRSHGRSKPKSEDLGGQDSYGSRPSPVVDFCEHYNEPSLEFIFAICIYTIIYVSWHADPLLDNDRETNNYTTAIAK